MSYVTCNILIFFNSLIFQILLQFQGLELVTEGGKKKKRELKGFSDFLVV